MCTLLLAACLLILAPVLNAQLTKTKYKVADGNPVGEKQIRYQVRLDIVPGYVCGGSIIDNQHVLTAAHCVTVTNSKIPKAVPTNYVTIRGGMTNVEDTSIKPKVEKIILHEGYDPTIVKNDLAILKVQNGFQFGDSVAPIERNNGPLTRRKGCVVSGWGHTDKNRQVQNNLQATEIDILDGSMCSGAFGKYFHEGKLCAGDPKGIKDACAGDSGGPLVCGNQLVGVVSSGKEICGDTTQVPIGIGLYVDVYYYKKWIDSKIKGKTLVKLIRHGFRTATIQEFPYQVLLFMDSGGICGGTILSKNFVLTAAHCVTLGNSSTPMPVGNLRVLAKLINMDEPGSQEYRVQKLIIHPKYNSVNFSNDLALLQTNIQQEDLQYVAVDIFNITNCSQTYGEQLENDKFCAGVAEQMDTCMGDPGGPLTCGGELVGIVSARIFCGKENNSGIRVYTDVYKHKTWIDKYVQNVSGSTSWQSNIRVIIYGVVITEMILFSLL